MYRQDIYAHSEKYRMGFLVRNRWKRFVHNRAHARVTTEVTEAGPTVLEPTKVMSVAPWRSRSDEGLQAEPSLRRFRPRRSEYLEL